MAKVPPFPSFQPSDRQHTITGSAPPPREPYAVTREASVRTSTRRTFLKGAGATIAAGAVVAMGRPRRLAADPVIGSWESTIYSLPNIAIHAAPIPGTTKIWMAQAKENPAALGTWAWVWDWANPTVPAVDASLPWLFDFMCGGHVWLPDGRLWIGGGRVNAWQTVIWDPATGVYTPSARIVNHAGVNMATYYPTVSLDGTGRPWLFLGNNPYTWYLEEAHDARMDILPAAVPGLGLSTGGLSQYPRMFLQDDGSWMMAGVMKPMRRLPVPTGYHEWEDQTWQNIAQWSNPRFEGCTFQRTTVPNTIVHVGGDLPATSRSIEYIDLTAPVPTAVLRPNALKAGHQAANLVTLPDGNHLLIGGRQGRVVELINDATLSTQAMAPLRALRGYHSVASLLADGRVFSAGDNGSSWKKHAAFYTPPQISPERGPRPAIALAGTANVTYGGTLDLWSQDGESIDRVTLIKCGAVSHGYNSQQKFHELAFTVSGTAVSATLPDNPNAAPPGHYTCWALRDGIWSEAVTVRLRGVE